MRVLGRLPTAAGGGGGGAEDDKALVTVAFEAAKGQPLQLSIALGDMVQILDRASPRSVRPR